MAINKKWEAKEVYGNWIVINESRNIVNIKDSKENAKLIAAAPELLRMVETLQFELTEAIKELQKKDYEIDFQTCYEAHELIKKATE